MPGGQPRRARVERGNGARRLKEISRASADKAGDASIGRPIEAGMAPAVFRDGGAFGAGALAARLSCVMPCNPRRDVQVFLEESLK